MIILELDRLTRDGHPSDATLAVRVRAEGSEMISIDGPQPELIDPTQLVLSLRSGRTIACSDNPEEWVRGLAASFRTPYLSARHHPRTAKRAGIEKHVTAHTLRHTAATWLRQEVGDTRLVAEYLGHADLSTVARYAHVDRKELFEAAGRLEELATPGDASASTAPLESTVEAPTNDSSVSDANQGDHPLIAKRQRRRSRRRRSGHRRYR